MGIIRFLLSLVSLVVSIAGWALLIYVALKLIIPQNKYTQQIGKYVEPLLSPVREWLRKTFPKLFSTGFDFSPVALWLLLEIAGWLINVIRGWL